MHKQILYITGVCIPIPSGEVKMLLYLMSSVVSSFPLKL